MYACLTKELGLLVEQGRSMVLFGNPFTMYLNLYNVLCSKRRKYYHAFYEGSIKRYNMWTLGEFSG